jgi:hypothetical protein
MEGKTSLKLEPFRTESWTRKTILCRATLDDLAAFAQGGSTSKETTQLLGRTTADIPLQERFIQNF